VLWGFRLTPALKLSIAGLVGSISNLFESKAKKAEYHEIIKRLYDLGHSTDKLANTILALMVVSTIEIALGNVPFMLCY
jgi:linoleate 10R-lipoxygenase